MNKSKPQRILGIDYGMRRFGLALSDERKIIAMPSQAFECDRRSEQTALKLVEVIGKLEKQYDCQIVSLVIGLPLMMSGKIGFIADEVKHFASLLQKLISIPIHLWDERLSTAQAEKALRETQLTRKRRTKMVDTVSAVIILQSYLDSLAQ